MKADVHTDNSKVTAELEEADKTFKELMKDDGGKIILTFLFSCMVMPKDEFEKFINIKERE